ncbi:MAG: hypothetical protein ACT4OK_06245 [Gemmobacter sp.]
MIDVLDFVWNDRAEIPELWYWKIPPAGQQADNGGPVAIDVDQAWAVEAIVGDDRHFVGLLHPDLTEPPQVFFLPTDCDRIELIRERQTLGLHLVKPGPAETEELPTRTIAFIYLRERKAAELRHGMVRSAKAERISAALAKKAPSAESGGIPFDPDADDAVAWFISRADRSQANDSDLGVLYPALHGFAREIDHVNLIGHVTMRQSRANVAERPLFSLTLLGMHEFDFVLEVPRFNSTFQRIDRAALVEDILRTTHVIHYRMRHSFTYLNPDTPLQALSLGHQSAFRLPAMVSYNLLENWETLAEALLLIVLMRQVPPEPRKTRRRGAAADHTAEIRTWLESRFPAIARMVDKWDGDQVHPGLAPFGERLSGIMGDIRTAFGKKEVHAFLAQDARLRAWLEDQSFRVLSERLITAMAPGIPRSDPTLKPEDEQHLNELLRELVETMLRLPEAAGRVVRENDQLVLHMLRFLAEPGDIVVVVVPRTILLRIGVEEVPVDVHLTLNNGVGQIARGSTNPGLGRPVAQRDVTQVPQLPDGPLVIIMPGGVNCALFSSGDGSAATLMDGRVLALVDGPVRQKVHELRGQGSLAAKGVPGLNVLDDWFKARGVETWSGDDYLARTLWTLRKSVGDFSRLRSDDLQVARLRTEPGFATRDIMQNWQGQRRSRTAVNPTVLLIGTLSDAVSVAPDADIGATDSAAIFRRILRLTMAGRAEFLRRVDEAMQAADWGRLLVPSSLLVEVPDNVRPVWHEITEGNANRDALRGRTVEGYRTSGAILDDLAREDQDLRDDATWIAGLGELWPASPVAGGPVPDTEAARGLKTAAGRQMVLADPRRAALARIMRGEALTGKLQGFVRQVLRSSDLTARIKALAEMYSRTVTGTLAFPIGIMRPDAQDHAAALHALTAFGIDAGDLLTLIAWRGLADDAAETVSALERGLAGDADGVLKYLERLGMTRVDLPADAVPPDAVPPDSAPTEDPPEPTAQAKDDAAPDP